MCYFFSYISIIPLKIQKNVSPNDNISDLIIESLNLHHIELCDKDIIIIAQKIISKSESRIFNLKDIVPSERALKIMSIHEKDPRLIELILRESSNIIRITPKVMIVETLHGFICANAGIDQSNVSSNYESVLLLPKNPDHSADRIRKDLCTKMKKNVAIVISDTFGRPFRNGQTNVAIGVAGIKPIKSYIGLNDSFGKILKVTEIAIVDELASAGELVMGKTLDIPIAIIRGYQYDDYDQNLDLDVSIKSLLRDPSQDLFRN